MLPNRERERAGKKSSYIKFSSGERTESFSLILGIALTMLLLLFFFINFIVKPSKYNSKKKQYSINVENRVFVRAKFFCRLPHGIVSAYVHIFDESFNISSTTQYTHTPTLSGWIDFRYYFCIHCLHARERIVQVFISLDGCFFVHIKKYGCFLSFVVLHFVQKK